MKKILFSLLLASCSLLPARPIQTYLGLAQARIESEKRIEELHRKFLLSQTSKEAAIYERELEGAQADLDGLSQGLW